MIPKEVDYILLDTRILTSTPSYVMLDACSPTGYACGQDRRRARREKERRKVRK